MDCEVTIHLGIRAKSPKSRGISSIYLVLPGVYIYIYARIGTFCWCERPILFTYHGNP